MSFFNTFHLLNADCLLENPESLSVYIHRGSNCSEFNKIT